MASLEVDRQSGATGAETLPPPLALHDEENTGAEATPRKDLISAILTAAFAAAVMILSVRIESPERLFTAPALLPFTVALALLLMAGALGWRAVRAGAARGFFAASAAAVRDYRNAEEDKRAALLAGLVLAYVLLVAAVSFELRVPVGSFEFVLSSYELISILVVTTVLRLFWRAGLVRCLLVAMAGVELLAWSFRYGFNILMPEAF